MTDQSMFETPQQPTQTTPATPETNSDPFVDKLKGIKNENGDPKYKDIGSALDALAASQQFIETLKGEKATLAQKYAALEAEKNELGSIDDFVKKINAPAQPATPTATTATVEGLSEEKVAELLNRTLAQREQQATQGSNLNKVISTLQEKFGAKSQEHISQRALALGTTPAALKELAMNNPAMAIELLSGVAAKTSSSPSQSSIVSNPSPHNANPKPTWERGAARGGLTNSELAERFKQSKEFTNKRIGLEL
jgi:hypothetical protein